MCLYVLEFHDACCMQESSNISLAVIEYFFARKFEFCSHVSEYDAMFFWNGDHPPKHHRWSECIT